MSENKRRNPAIIEGPDQGWSWVVAVSCCLLNMLLFGMSRISSLLFVASVKTFPITRKEASLPFSLASSVRCLSGPLSGFLAHKFGVRQITIAGGILGALGIGLCSLANNILWVTISWGVLFGIGFGMGNTLLPISINEYFNKYRASASGLSYSGACLGSFVLPPLVDVCLKEFNLNGTFMVLSGIVLNCIPLAMLLRKPSFVVGKVKTKSTPKHFTVENAYSKNTDQKNKNNSSVELHNRNSCLNEENKMKDGVQLNTKTLIEQSEQLATQIELRSFLNHASSAICESSAPKNPEILTITRDDKTIEYNNTNVIGVNPEFQKNHWSKPVINSIASKQGEKFAIKRNMKLFLDPMFILITVCTGLYGYSFTSINTIIVDFAVDIGVDMSGSAYILMILSIGDFIGRIALGSLIDRGFMSTMQFTGTFFLLQAISIICLTWVSGFQVLAVVCFIYGMFEAALIISTPLLIAEHFEPDLQTVAIPSIHVFSGFIYLTIPNLIGFFREHLGSYFGIFYTMGAISFACAIPWFVLSFYIKHRHHYLK